MQPFHFKGSLYPFKKCFLSLQILKDSFRVVFFLKFVLLCKKKMGFGECNNPFSSYWLWTYSLLTHTVRNVVTLVLCRMHSKVQPMLIWCFSSLKFWVFSNSWWIFTVCTWNAISRVSEEKLHWSGAETISIIYDTTKTYYVFLFSFILSLPLY